MLSRQDYRAVFARFVLEVVRRYAVQVAVLFGGLFLLGLWKTDDPLRVAVAIGLIAFVLLAIFIPLIGCLAWFLASRSKALSQQYKAACTKDDLQEFSEKVLELLPRRLR